MKIGFSYSRCVRDIVDGVVDPRDVLVIITRTDFDPHDDEQWAGIWQGYRQGGLSRAEWSDATDGQEARYREVSIELWQSGKLHQPRKFGSHPPRSPYTWVDTGPIGIERQPQAVKDAWENYKILSSLAQNSQARLHDDF